MIKDGNASKHYNSNRALRMDKQRLTQRRYGAKEMKSNDLRAFAT
jgi:hypothetical protein